MQEDRANGAVGVYSCAAAPSLYLSSGTAKDGTEHLAPGIIKTLAMPDTTVYNVFAQMPRLWAPFPALAKHQKQNTTSVDTFVCRISRE